MRLARVELAWFRGAASKAELVLDGRSAVVFGTNGSGKSSFVDGVEVCMTGGKVGHLIHEYSGRYQDKGLINTRRPDAVSTRASVSLSDQTAASLEWVKGAPLSNDSSLIRSWDYRRTILRQDDITQFIRASKTDRYSAVLPLLGLGHLETVAENLRKTEREIVTVSRLEQMRLEVAAAQRQRSEVFGDAGIPALLGVIRELQQKYGVQLDGKRGPAAVDKTIEAIKARIATLDAQSREAAALQELRTASIKSQVAEIRALDGQISQSAEPLVKERLEVLSASSNFALALSPEATELTCPACGAVTTPDQFNSHVTAERTRLEEVDALFERRKEAVSSLCDELSRIKSLVEKPDLSAWTKANGERLERAQAFLAALGVSQLRSACVEADLVAIEGHLAAIAAIVAASATTAPPDAQAMIDDQQRAAVIASDMRSAATRARIARVEALTAFTADLETGVREEIRSQAAQVFSTISADIQRFWAVLQPGDKIKDVGLHVPQDSAKAIEIHLAFYGVQQESPRLTLSEGQRSALGLCVFLAMAKQSSGDQPIILDDVVISMDRAHRSNVLPLIEAELADRQVILFTHDREWCFELQRRQPTKGWKHYRLRPFVDPATGIQFEEHGTDFASARGKIATDPGDALSNVRRMMDVALSELAERLGVLVPHLRGDDNDHRTAGNLLFWINRRVPKALKLKDREGAYQPHRASIDLLGPLTENLVIWANRATHTYSANEVEAKTTIDQCEAFLGHFECARCSSSLGALRAENGDLQCRCGSLKWKPN
jgi:hypothetical protein